jgi:hypothetical protein
MTIYYCGTGQSQTTIDDVNSLSLSDGDSVLFNRGETFRGQLLPSNGSSSGYITYGSYGDGPNPLIYGSKRKNLVADWTDLGSNIWECKPGVNVTGSELLPNPSFDTIDDYWFVYNNTSHGASSTVSRTTTAGEFQSANGGGKLSVTTKGTENTDIQLYTQSLSITSGKWYKVTFYAKSSAEIQIYKTNVIKNASPFTSYTSYFINKEPVIGTDFDEYTQYFKANTTASDARLVFYVGKSIEDGGVFYFDTLSVKETDATDDSFIYLDAGNIIFNDGGSVGVKKFSSGDLASQGDFWYDRTTASVRLYSAANPASYYSDIEIALTQNMVVGQLEYVIFENLTFKYGGRHGIGLSSGSNNIIARDCKFYFIGGGSQYGGTSTTRLGNAFQIWNSANNVVVERCFFKDIFDEAITFQGSVATIDNIIIRNNIYTDTRVGITVWVSSSGSVSNIYVVNNIGSTGDGGWQIDQMSGSGSSLLSFQSNPAVTISNIVAKNNILYADSYMPSQLLNIQNQSVSGLYLDNNCFYRSDSGRIVSYLGTYYNTSDFSTYKTATGQDANSIISNPLLRSDYGLQASSPAKDAGTSLSQVTNDYLGVSRPQGSGYDMGAFEYLEGINFNGIILNGITVS